MAELGTCPTPLDGIGDGGCISSPILKMVTGFIPSLESQSFASLADFNNETKNKEAIAAGSLLPLKVFDEIEEASVEELTSETSTGTKLYHRNGKYGFTGKMLLTPDQNRVMQSYNGKVKSGYIMDAEGNRLGTSPDGIAVKGLTVSYFRAKPMELPFAADGSSWSAIEVQFEYVEEINKQPMYSIASDLDWIPTKTIQPTTKLTVTPGTISTFIFTCAFAYVDPTTGKSVPLTGLSADGSDLIVLEQAGSVEAVTVAPTAVDGTYTITGTTITSGSIQLVASADSLYYSDATVVAS